MFSPFAPPSQSPLRTTVCLSAATSAFRFFTPGAAPGVDTSENVHPGRAAIVRENPPFASFGTATATDSDRVVRSSRVPVSVTRRVTLRLPEAGAFTLTAAACLTACFPLCAKTCTVNAPGLSNVTSRSILPPASVASVRPSP